MTRHKEVLKNKRRANSPGESCKVCKFYLAKAKRCAFPYFGGTIKVEEDMICDNYRTSN